MATPHIAANPGDIAPTLLMPGDPLRAKFIAETFLESPVQFNGVRGMLGYTGSYRGRDVSVMGSGMGMPSIGIYSYELYTKFDVENIIRIGSCGSYSPDLQLFDVLMATGSWSESSFALTQNGYDKDTTYPSETLNQKLKNAAAAAGIALHEGLIHSSDVFYSHEAEEGGKPYWKRLFEEKGCLAVEMESFALFHNAAVTDRHAACLLTVSDNFNTAGLISTEEREKSFTNMMQVALGAALL